MKKINTSEINSNFSPVDNFARIVIAKSFEVERWFRSRWQVTPPPFYTSVDVRNSGYQITTVDTNLFPAGFNNLHQNSKSLAVQAVFNAVESVCPKAMRALLIPENHTRNQYYLANVWHLQKILQIAGVEVAIGSLDPNITSPQTINIDSQFINPQEENTNYSFEVLPIIRDKEKVYVKKDGSDFIACMILLNNDLSGGFPEILKNINQPIYPPPQLGWHRRKKSHHFKIYHKIAEEFIEYFNLPKGVLQCEFDVVDNIDFHQSESLKALITSAEKMFNRLHARYSAQGIPHKPYIVIKSDAGTYGMAVMAVNNIEELINLNRKARNKLAVGKDGLTTNRVLLQEGIHSIENVEGKAAEQVIYMVGNCAVGGFYRIHPDKGDDGVLNAPGMHFREIPFNSCCNLPEKDLPPNFPLNQHYVAGVVARLAALAAATEIVEVNNSKIG